MKVFKKFAFYALPMLMLTGCFKNNEELDKYWVDIATVENPELKNEFFFRLDDNTLMWTETSVLDNYKPADGQRIIANYTILSNKKATGLYDYDVKVNNIYEVLTKGIFAVTPATQDSIGNDSIYVEDKSVWIGSDYLNIEFLYQGKNKDHFVNLVIDSLKTYNDDKIHLEFRHNANNDEPAYNHKGVVSFNLRELKNEMTDSVRLAIHVNLPNKLTDTVYERTYHYKNTPSSVKSRRVLNISNYMKAADVE